MTTAYLTIDDGPSPNTPQYMDHLQVRGITPVLFLCGQALEAHWLEALDAVRRDAIVANHGYTHEPYSGMDLDACIRDIERQEALLDRLCLEAGVPREHRLFRFPRGDKGGRNEGQLQTYLREKGFSRLDDRSITHAWYHALGWGRDVDVPCTFDLEDHKLHTEADSFTYDDILRHIEDRQPSRGSLYDGTLQIISVHDHPETEAVRPGYFAELIDALLAAGVRFIRPRVYQP